MGKKAKKSANKFDFYFSIDKKRVKSLIPREQVTYFENLMKRILAAPVVEPVLVMAGNVEYEVSRKDAVVFLEAYKGLLSSSLVWEIEKNKMSYRLKSLVVGLKDIVSSLGTGEERVGIGSTSFKLIRNGAAVAMSALILTSSASAHLKRANVNLFPAFYTGISARAEYDTPPAEDIVELDIEQIKRDAAERRRQEAIRLAEEAKEQERLAEEARQAKFDTYIKEYCLYLNLDSAKVIEIARTLTDNYTTGFEGLIGNEIFTPTNDESGCLLFVFRLSRDNLTVKLSEFGLTRVDLVIDDSVYGNDREEGDELILRCGLTGTQFLGKISDLIDLDKYYALSISYLEAGKRFSSPICRGKNNFGGMRAKGEYFTYPSPEAGIIAFCMNLKNYEKFSLTSIEELSGVYVNGDRTKPSPTWIKNVQGYHYTFTQNASEYFLADEVTTEVDDVHEYSMVMTPVSQR